MTDFQHITSSTLNSVMTHRREGMIAQSAEGV